MSGCLPLLLVLAWGPPAFASRTPDEAADKLIQQAFDLAYNLDYEEAMRVLERATAAHPDEAAVHRAAAAVIWMDILFTRGAVTVDHYLGGVSRARVDLAEPPADLAAAFHHHADRAVALAERQAAAGGGEHAYYDLGAGIGLLASYAATVEGRVRAAFGHARRAYDAHERVLAIAPQRADAGLIVGTYRYMVAGLRLPLRWVAYVAGFGGGRERGLQLVEDAAASASLVQAEARFALVVLYNRERRFDEALAVLADLQRAYPRNRLVLLEIGATRLRAGRARAAEEILTEGLSKLADDPRPRARGEEALWRYKRGAARVMLRRAAGARADLRAALDSRPPDWVRGRAHLELGKLADLEGSRALALQEYERAILLSDSGNDPLAADEARRLQRSAYRGD